MATTLVDRPIGGGEEPSAPLAAISADSHVIEPIEAYADHIDPAYRDRAPKLGMDPDKGEAYVIDGMPARIAVTSVAACGSSGCAKIRP